MHLQRGSWPLSALAALLPGESLLRAPATTSGLLLQFVNSGSLLQFVNSGSQKQAATGGSKENNSGRV